eukprot:4768245-Ditylum_brightwellii.AAC.1
MPLELKIHRVVFEKVLTGSSGRVVRLSPLSMDVTPPPRLAVNTSWCPNKYLVGYLPPQDTFM